MIKRCIRLVTRQSKLALWQASFVKNRLESLHPNLTIQLHPISTRGDRVLDTPLFTMGGKGLFTEELEEQLLSKKADLAVHSMKDLPATFSEGLEMAAILQRANAQDAFVSILYPTLNDLPKGAKVGTSSLRRQCQLLALRPDLYCLPLRGNVDTRLQKLERGDFDAIILAVSGLERLDCQEYIREYLSVDVMLPAAGQGALGVECRVDDTEMKEYLASLNHPATVQCVSAERALIVALDGGCSAPIASYAEIRDEKIYLRGLVGKADGSHILRAEGSGTIMDAKALGDKVAEQLKQQGAKAVLES